MIAQTIPLRVFATVKPFDKNNAPDMIDTDATYSAKGFTVTSTPSMWTIQAQQGSSGLTVPAATSTTYMIGGTGVAADIASVTVYREVIATLEVFARVPEVAKMRVFDLLWELHPNAAYTYIDDGTSEPHYYEYVSTAQLYSTALATCATKKVFGLKGYLLVVDSAGVNAYIGQLNVDLWLGISDAATEGTWKITTGPKAGQ
eukprot:PhM_4_TR13964/c2_g2_i1/m.91688